MAFLSILFICNSAYAQLWEEWFQQKKTQIKYLEQQIAALKVYTDYAKKGYEVVSSGVNLVNDIKNGDFSLHNDYFGSLKQINPAISNSVKVAEILAYQFSILKLSNDAVKSVQSDKNFTAEEINYLKKVFNNLMQACSAVLDELLLATGNNELEMKDGERLKWIDRLYMDMKDKYAFARSFSQQSNVLSVQRSKEQSEISISKKLNGLH